MREILFRGRIKNEEQSEFYDKWFFGDLHQLYDGSTFIRQVETGSGLEVIPSTVGQYAGLKDKNGDKIFEGDIIYHEEHKGYLLPNFNAVVVWVNEYACFGYKRLDTPNWNFPTYLTEHDELQTDFLNYVTVIGNIHDNPELLI
jgi:hypothetical protein